MIKLITIILITSCSVAYTQQQWQFDNIQHQQQFFKLLTEIRCVVCQNQSLADSNADLAQDMRNIIYQQFKNGNNNQQINS